MELKPSRPPGHANRKLRGFVSEIARLRAEGYTIHGIQQALAEAGVEVGWTTVQREAARLTQPLAAARPNQEPASVPARAADAGTDPPRSVPTSAEVDKFFEHYNTNPLLRRKDKS